MSKKDYYEKNRDIVGINGSFWDNLGQNFQTFNHFLPPNKKYHFLTY